MIKYRAKIKGVLTGYTVAMVTFYVKKLATTRSTMIGHSFDTIFATSTDKQWKYWTWMVLGLNECVILELQ